MPKKKTKKKWEVERTGMATMSEWCLVEADTEEEALEKASRGEWLDYSEEEWSRSYSRYNGGTDWSTQGPREEE